VGFGSKERDFWCFARAENGERAKNEIWGLFIQIFSSHSHHSFYPSKTAVRVVESWWSLIILARDRLTFLTIKFLENAWDFRRGVTWRNELQ